MRGRVNGIAVVRSNCRSADYSHVTVITGVSQVTTAVRHDQSNLIQHNTKQHNTTEVNIIWLDRNQYINHCPHEYTTNTPNNPPHSKQFPSLQTVPLTVE
jgi:hypothetical protein